MEDGSCDLARTEGGETALLFSVIFSDSRGKEGKGERGLPHYLVILSDGACWPYSSSIILTDWQYAILRISVAECLKGITIIPPFEDLKVLSSEI